MFRKPPNIKSEQRLSDKDVKKLQVDAAHKLFMSADQAAELLPRKPGLIVRQCGGGMTARIFTSEQRAVAFGTGDGGIVPSLPSVWRLPAGTFATLHVPEPVAGFMLNGSDLMLPGVHGVSLPDGADPDECLAPGGIACVAVFGNPCAFAVGKLLVGRSEIEAQISGPGCVKGRCLTTLHVFGDHLWQSSGALLPNAGFVVTEEAKGVHALQSAACTACTAGSAETCSVRGGAGADEPRAGAANASDPGDGGADDGASGGREAQDRLLESCFLQAAHAVSDKALPLPLNTFYANHMRPNRPAGTSLDVKASSHKKLLPFLRSLEARGLCTLSQAGPAAEPLLRSIVRAAPEYLNHEVWSATAAESSDSRTGLPPLTVSLLYRPGEAQRPLFPPDRKALYDEPAALRVLHLHIDAERGIAGRRGDGGGEAERCKGDVSVLIDQRLADALFSGQMGSLPTQLSLGEVRHKWVGLLEPWTRVAGGSLAKPALRPGKAPALVSIHTEQRRGHMVTVIGGVHVLGIDERQLADELQALVGAAAGVEGTPTKEGPPRLDVMVQGLWDRAVAEHLCAVHGVPARVVENRAAGRAGMHQKKDKAATNVRKS